MMACYERFRLDSMARSAGAWRGLAIVLIALGLALPGAAAQSARSGNMELVRRPYVAPVPQSEEPVRMVVIARGQTTEYPVLATEDGVEVRVPQQRGSIIYPWDDLGDININLTITPDIRRALQMRDPGQKASALEAVANRLAPFAGIPEGSTNLHQILIAYYEALRESNELDTAYALSKKLPLDSIPPSLAEELFLLSRKQFAEGKTRDGWQLITVLYAARPPEEFMEQTLGLAEALSSSRHFEAALNLYRPIIDLVAVEQRKEVALNGAYLALELDDMAAYDHFRSIAQDAPGDDPRLMGMELVLEGIRALRDEDTRSALRTLGHALAIVPADSRWKEAALYYNHESYRSEGQRDIAGHILEEMELLFPSGAYTLELKGGGAPTESTNL